MLCANHLELCFALPVLAAPALSPLAIGFVAVPTVIVFVVVCDVYLRLRRRIARSARGTDAVSAAVEFPLLGDLSAPHQILSVTRAGYQLGFVDNFAALSAFVR